MKKSLFLLAVASILLASCTKDNGTEDASSNDAMSFGTFTYTMSKKVAIDDNIKLYAVNKDVPTASWFFYQQKLNYASTTVDKGNYTYSPLRYWPTSQTNGINFYASAPFESSTAIGWPTNSATIDTMAIITYTVPAAANEDFKMAKLGSVKKLANNDPVTLVFEHMLSKVTIGTFEFQNLLPGYTAAVTKVELTGLANSATRVFNAPPTDAWTSPSGTAGNYTRPTTGAVATTLATPLYIMPQTFDNLDSLVLTLTLTDPVELGQGTSTKRIAIALNDASKSNWQVAEKGKNYILNLELDADKQYDVIRFEAQVNDWTASNVLTPVVQPSVQKLNSMMDNDILVIGGTSATNKFNLTGAISWNWSNSATYVFNNLTTTGHKFKLTFTGAVFDVGAKITISVPTGFKVYIGATSVDTQTVDVTSASNEVWIEKK